MSVINPDNKKMLLSCDGGGIRGLIAVRCLEKLERIEGKPCNEIFQLMAGTSTGAIIVAGLAMGIPASKLAELYILKGKEIFHKTPNLLTRWLKWTYSKDGVRKLFKDTYGDKLLRELPVDILIIAQDTVECETIYFQKKKFGKMLLREAVESSMSAPTYFQPNGSFVDGGIGSFNNPCYQAAVEALHYLNYPRSQTALVSFGTGRWINSLRDGEAEKKNKIWWIKYVIGEGMDDANDLQVQLVRREYVKRGDLSFKRYQISFTGEALSQIGIQMNSIPDPRAYEMDAVKYTSDLNLIANKFADYITFEEPEGVELGTRPSLNERKFMQFLRS